MSVRVELIYDRDCPNVQQARAALLQAFEDAGIAPKWTEWARQAPDSPVYVRQFGSPTVLVNGKDVAGDGSGGTADCCRLYPDGLGRWRPAPPPDLIAASLPGKSGWRSSLASLPGIGGLLLPVGLCPACWPAYAGVLASAGLGFLLDQAYLLPLSAGLLLLALASLAWRARSRRGYGPLALGAAGSAVALLAKFWLAQDMLLYAGLAVLVVAAAWNAWPRRSVCPACQTNK